RSRSPGSRTRRSPLEGAGVGYYPGPRPTSIGRGTEPSVSSHRSFRTKLLDLLAGQAGFHQDLGRVVAQVRPVAAHAALERFQVDRRPDDVRGAAAPVLDRHGHAEVLHLGVREDLGDIVDGTAGYADLLERVDPVGGRLGARHLGHRSIDARAVLAASLGSLPFRNLEPLR